MDFIHIEQNSLDKETCAKIIKLFEQDQNKYQGVTSSGYDPKKKNTMDLSIYFKINRESNWYEINTLLVNKMQTHIESYMSKIKNILNSSNVMFTELYDCEFLIQKYDKNQGIFRYHNDFIIEPSKFMYRIVTFIWYLNDVEDGGETEFCGDFTIRPEVGKLVFFPASWCYPHRGKMPISSDKYIITGWLHIK